jgi:hypothetical protein
MRARQRFQPLMLLLNRPGLYIRRYGVAHDPKVALGLRVFAGVLRAVVAIGPLITAAKQAGLDGPTAGDPVDQFTRAMRDRIPRGELAQALWLATAGDDLVAQTLKAHRNGDHDRARGLLRGAVAGDAALRTWAAGYRERANPREMSLARRVRMSRTSLGVLEAFADMLKEVLRASPALASISAKDLPRVLEEAVSTAARSGALDLLLRALPDLDRLRRCALPDCGRFFLRARSKRAQRYCDRCRRRWTPKQRWTRARRPVHDPPAPGPLPGGDRHGSAH